MQALNASPTCLCGQKAAQNCTKNVHFCTDIVLFLKGMPTTARDCLTLKGLRATVRGMPTGVSKMPSGITERRKITPKRKNSRSSTQYSAFEGASAGKWQRDDYAVRH